MLQSCKPASILRERRWKNQRGTSLNFVFLSSNCRISSCCIIYSDLVFSTLDVIIKVHDTIAHVVHTVTSLGVTGTYMDRR